MTQVPNKPAKDISSLSFEAALAELEKIVSGLEGGKETLDTAISGYELGNALKEHCEKKLKEAQLRVDKIVQKEPGILSTEPLDS